MNERNVLVRHDINTRADTFSQDIRVDETADGKWLVTILVYLNWSGELHKNGVFYIPQEAKSVKIDFGSFRRGRKKSVKYCITEEFYEDDAIELDWDDAKIAQS